MNHAPITHIDLNCDLAEGAGHDHELMPLISSCNICCGEHAGDENEIKKSLELAAKFDVRIGAHPGYPDRVNFGRKVMDLSNEALQDTIIEQISKVQTLAIEFGLALHHVKPHGALYNLAAEDEKISELIIKAIQAVNPDLQLYGLANSQTALSARNKIRFVAEGFADRKYSSHRKLTARSKGGLLSIIQIEQHLSHLILNQQVDTEEGIHPLEIQTLCLHGDTPDTVAIAQKIRNLLQTWEVKIQPVENGVI